MLHRLWLMLATIVLSVPQAWADCPSVSVISPSGRYRFDASPAGEGAGPCKGFILKLTDTTTGATLWERRQKPVEQAPTEAWVSDSGRVVIDNGMHRSLGAAAGDQEHVWITHAGLSSVDRPYVKERVTSAGVISNIDLLSRRFLLEHEGALYFVTRYYWGKHTFVDLDARRVIDAPGESLLQAATDADRRFVLAALDGAAKRIEAAQWDRRRAPMAQEAQIAIFIAGQLKMREAVPLLREMEACADVSAWGAGTGRAWPGGPRFKLHALRRAAHVALRRIGETPGPEPSYTLLSGQGWSEPEPGKTLDRAKLRESVAAGMQASALFALAGPPDWARELPDEKIGDAFVVLWEYDVDAPEPATLRVYINPDGEVTKVVNTTPPTWAEGFHRDIGDW